MHNLTQFAVIAFAGYLTGRLLIEPWLRRKAAAIRKWHHRHFATTTVATTKTTRRPATTTTRRPRRPPWVTEGEPASLDEYHHALDAAKANPVRRDKELPPNVLPHDDTQSHVFDQTESEFGYQTSGRR